MPAPSTAQQKALVSEVVQVTQADSKTAAKLLAKSQWNSSAAINAYVSYITCFYERGGWMLTRSPSQQLLQQPLKHRLKSHP